MSTANLPHLTVLLAALGEHPEGLTPDQLLEAMADRGTKISRPTLNRLLVQGRDAGKLVAAGLTTGRTYRLANEAEQNAHQSITAPAKAQAGGLPDIVSAYGTRVWDTADVLRGVGIKQSEWSGHMMPFFALMLLEARIFQLRDEAMDELFGGGQEYNERNAEHLSDLRDYYTANTAGTGSAKHEPLLFSGQGLAHIAKGGASGIEARLRNYLSGYDGNTQRLLGYGASTQEKFLGIDTTIKTLANKGSEHLFQWVKQWSLVDLRAYKSADITTLEEHIKRRWADISADTAGEHYTPTDLFHLVTELAVDHFERHPLDRDVMTVYDPTCGGGNMLFGVSDRLRELSNAQGKYMTVRALGQEINDTLYALAAVESQFRPNSDIRYGNTLTADHFTGEKFDLIVANPPYGVDWKGIEKDITKDATGRFPAHCRPPLSDGQHLFLQHILEHLNEGGLAFVFTSGSTLFSGDAGGGESNARFKYFQTDDDVLGVIQLPKDEFFNTGINTYLWIFKKNKPKALVGRAFFLDTSDLATKLRKSLGSKRNELNEQARAQVVKAVGAVEDQANVLLKAGRDDSGRRLPALGLDRDSNTVDLAQSRAILRLLDTDEVGYTKLELELTRGRPAWSGATTFKQADLRVLPQGLNEDAARAALMTGEDCLRLSTTMPLDEAIEQVAKFEVAIGVADDLDERIQELQGDPKTLVASVKTYLGEHPVRVTGEPEAPKKTKDKAAGTKCNQALDIAWNVPGQPQERTLYCLALDRWQDVGRAALSVAVKIKTDKKSGEELLTLAVGLGPDMDKDTETVPFSRNSKERAKFEQAFLARWVKDPYVITKSTDGCEVNFNRLFPKTGERKTLAEVNAEIAALDAKLGELAKGVAHV